MSLNDLNFTYIYLNFQQMIINDNPMTSLFMHMLHYMGRLQWWKYHTGTIPYGNRGYILTALAKNIRCDALSGYLVQVRR